MSLSLQRLFVILISLIFLTSAVILILNNAKKNMVFFFTPSELFEAKINIGEKIRIGGFIKKNSLSKKEDNRTYNFIITDNSYEIKIDYNGILPDLFKEEQGAVIEGTLINDDKILATRVFAKHDENYMPSSIKKQLKNSNYWKTDYLDSVPNFQLTSLFDNKKLTNKDIKNNITIINFFASWCVPCKEEHPILFKIKKKFHGINIIGIAYKDKHQDSKKFLEENNNPYFFVGTDDDGKIGLQFGVMGLPETFVIDAYGKIIFKHLGPLTSKIEKNDIAPLLQ